MILYEIMKLHVCKSMKLDLNRSEDDQTKQHVLLQSSSIVLRRLLAIAKPFLTPLACTFNETYLSLSEALSSQSFRVAASGYLPCSIHEKTESSTHAAPARLDAKGGSP